MEEEEEDHISGGRTAHLLRREETPIPHKWQEAGVQAYESMEEEDGEEIKNQDITKATTTVFEERTPMNLTQDAHTMFKSSRARISHNEGLLTQEMPRASITSVFPDTTPKRDVPRLALGLPPCVPKPRGKEGTRILKTVDKEKQKVLLWREKENASLHTVQELMAMKKEYKEHKRQEQEIRKS